QDGLPERPQRRNFHRAPLGGLVCRRSQPTSSVQEVCLSIHADARQWRATLSDFRFHEKLLARMSPLLVPRAGLYGRQGVSLADRSGVSASAFSNKVSTWLKASSGRTKESERIFGSSLISSGKRTCGRTWTAKISWTASSNFRRATVRPVVRSTTQTPHVRSVSRSIKGMPLKTADSGTCDNPMKARLP